ncbi:MAG: hypothetical protein WC959_02165 [Kiritimatiellales bacterium]
MKPLVITVLLFAAGSIQALMPIEFPALLCLMIFIALHSRLNVALYGAVIAGLIHDSFCPAPLGISIPFFLLTVFVINYIRREIFSDIAWTYVILGGLFALLKTLYFILILALFNIRPVRTAELFLQLVAGVLVALFLAPGIFLAAAPFRDKWYRRALR